MENIISWNFANWVTVVIMGLLGYALLTLIVKTLQLKRGSENA